MFDYMFGVLFTLCVVAAIPFVAAMVAEGRGSYLVRMMFHATPPNGPQRLTETWTEDVPRGGYSWDLLDYLDSYRAGDDTREPRITTRERAS